MALQAAHHQASRVSTNRVEPRSFSWQLRRGQLGTATAKAAHPYPVADGCTKDASQPDMAFSPCKGHGFFWFACCNRAGHAGTLAIPASQHEPPHRLAGRAAFLVPWEAPRPLSSTPERPEAASHPVLPALPAAKPSPAADSPSPTLRDGTWRTNSRVDVVVVNVGWPRRTGQRARALRLRNAVLRGVPPRGRRPWSCRADQPVTAGPAAAQCLKCTACRPTNAAVLRWPPLHCADAPPQRRAGRGRPGAPCHPLRVCARAREEACGMLHGQEQAVPRLPACVAPCLAAMERRGCK
eukprot:363203-Chlamydomonas_euryale.AAC.3